MDAVKFVEARRRMFAWIVMAGLSVAHPKAGAMWRRADNGDKEGV